jgi:hypothetical protein
MNDLDRFRSDFFDRVIKTAKEKERRIQEKQRKCFHTYTIFGQIYKNYQEVICSKCGHKTVKGLQKKEGCVIN